MLKIQFKVGEDRLNKSEQFFNEIFEETKN